MDALLQTVFNAPSTPSLPAMAPSSVNDTLAAASSFNSTESNSFQDFIFSFALSFAPFLKDLPDWLKLAILGGFFETSRRYLTSWYYALKSAMFITVVFDSNDTSFQWMMSWISRQPAFNKARQMEVSTRYSSGESGSAIFSEDDEKIDDDDKNLKYIPTPAVSYSMWYKNRWMEITRTKSGGQGYYDEETDRMTLRILTRDRKLVSSLLREAKRAYTKQAEQSICVYVNDQSDNWRHVACRAKRPLRSIILDPGVVDLLLEDARDFLDSKQWYADRGIPHRRGYLLYGKPGSGKTSLIQAIAGELGLHVYIISLSRAGLDDTTLSSAIGDLPSRCIALMEDIDAAFTRGISRDKDEESAGDGGEGAPAGPKPAGPKEGPASRVTLSGLLNALDGVGAQEGRILFATTNRYQTLDSALIRPGRLDLHIEFKYASRFQVEELFRTFYQPLRGEKEDSEKQVEKDKTGDLKEKESTPNLDVPSVDLGPAIVTTEKALVAPPTPSTSGSVSANASPVAAPTTDVHVTPSDESSKSGLAFGTSHSARAPAFSVAQYDALAKQFAAQVPTDTFSMAALQGYLMTYKIRPVQAVKDVAAWVEKEKREQRGASTMAKQVKESDEKLSESS